MGNDSGELGHNLMDHHNQAGANGTTDMFSDSYYYGRRPNGIYIPRFRNVTSQRDDYVRGFGFQGNSQRSEWQRGSLSENIGADLKRELQQPGPWSMHLGGFGECLPYHDNKVTLDHGLRDKWGLPTLRIDCSYKENERKMRLDMAASAAEILEAAGLKNVTPFNREDIPGLGIHEMGTARMGNDPKTSVLNKFNQIHAVKNVFVTDGSCMTSSACQNPSMTYMALTARAADYAVSELQKRNL
jgi:choline dehydrogenase-like flavoprotein